MKKSFPLYFLAILLSGFFIFPHITAYFSGNYYLGQASYQYLFGSETTHYPLLSMWREYVGTSSVPVIFDISYSWPLRLLFLLTNGSYLSWILYGWAIYSFGTIAASLYIKRLFPALSLVLSLAIGLLYTSFIPNNMEASSFFSLKIAAVLLPLCLYLILKLHDYLTTASTTKFLLTSIMLAILSLNIIFHDARCFIALIIIGSTHIVCFIKSKKIKSSLIFLVTILIWLASSLLLFFPFKYALDTLYATSAQLSIPVSEGVINQFISQSQFLSLALPPYHTLSPLELIFNNILRIGILIGIFIFIKMKNRLNIQYIIIIIGMIYLILTDTKVSEILTLHLPYGQVFRSWRVQMYLAGILIILPLGTIHYFKNKIIKGIFIALMLSYFIISLQTIWPTYSYGKKDAINQYRQANEELKKLEEDADPKVLWVPEMGWFAHNLPSSIAPDWATNSFQQAFPELISSLPTYTHYNNQMTHIYTWLASGVWQSQVKNNTSVTNLLNILGIQYLLVHNDVSDYKNDVAAIEKNLQKAKGIKKIFSNDLITIYKNTTYQGRIWATRLDKSFWCDSGYICLSDYYKNISPYQQTSFLTDLQFPISAMKKVDRIYIDSSKPANDGSLNLMINYLEQDHQGSQIIFPKEFFNRLFRVSCVSDTHQGLHHTYFDIKQTYAYDNSFLFDNCFFVSDSPQAKSTFPVTLKAGSYKVVIRYFKNIKGGNFIVDSKYFSRNINSLGEINGVSGFIYDVSDLLISKDDTFNVNFASSGETTNLVNVIGIIPTSLFNKKEQEFFKIKKMSVNTDPSSTVNTQLSNIVRNNATTWSLNYQSNSPSILNFAEEYNPYWKLKIVNNSGKTLTFNARQGYGMINSFIIDRPIQGRVTIYYEPQKTFFNRLFLSIILIGVVLGAIVIFLKKYRVT